MLSVEQKVDFSVYGTKKPIRAISRNLGFVQTGSDWTYRGQIDVRYNDIFLLDDYFQLGNYLKEP